MTSIRFNLLKPREPFRLDRAKAKLNTDLRLIVLKGFRDLFPLYRSRDIFIGFWVPGEIRIYPSCHLPDISRRIEGFVADQPTPEGQLNMRRWLYGFAFHGKIDRLGRIAIPEIIKATWGLKPGNEYELIRQGRMLVVKIETNIGSQINQPNP
ncbi:hypothetical protein A2311_02410 [candidate division WOR-1 bacterium RIFOXYB2_FULL_48_7]|uniref:SpoVT-AbrB domain-containing protein n=1 Tax=candidate division WOR-1 bacterium RIFOXYB2_FULL_48_7 TaxID=1802583 RepID=A0A1F4TWD5_UNCSA|nr:MAG: hypothetical protein A2311_02410 [candidate division WOR-1 bacterium RIFOXYB2_FULL_48_7]